MNVSAPLSVGWPGRSVVSALRGRRRPGRLFGSAATEECPWLPGRRCGSASLCAHRPLERVATAEAKPTATAWPVGDQRSSDAPRPFRASLLGGR